MACTPTRHTLASPLQSQESSKAPLPEKPILIALIILGVVGLGAAGIGAVTLGAQQGIWSAGVLALSQVHSIVFISVGGGLAVSGSVASVVLSLKSNKQKPVESKQEKSITPPQTPPSSKVTESRGSRNPTTTTPVPQPDPPSESFTPDATSTPDTQALRRNVQNSSTPPLRSYSPISVPPNLSTVLSESENNTSIDPSPQKPLRLPSSHSLNESSISWQDRLNKQERKIIYDVGYFLKQKQYVVIAFENPAHPNRECLIYRNDAWTLTVRENSQEKYEQIKAHVEKNFTLTPYDIQVLQSIALVGERLKNRQYSKQELGGMEFCIYKIKNRIHLVTNMDQLWWKMDKLLSDHHYEEMAIDLYNTTRSLDTSLQQTSTVETQDLEGKVYSSAQEVFQLLASGEYTVLDPFGDDSFAYFLTKRGEDDTENTVTKVQNNQIQFQVNALNSMKYSFKEIEGRLQIQDGIPITSN